MASGNIQLQPEQVTQIATNIRTNSETILNMMTQLTSQIQSVAGASWQGQASQVFEGAWQEWQASFTSLRESLNDMPPALDGLVQNMVQADQSLQLG